MRNTSRFFEPMLVERVFEARTAGKGGQFKKGGGRVEAGAEAQYTQKEVKDLITSSHSQFQSEGTLDQRVAVSSYTGMGYRGTNYYLRGKKSDGSKATPPSPRTIKDVGHIDSAFEEHGTVLQKEAVLYRGMHAKALSKFEEEGSTVRDKGLVSASAELRMADHFASGGLPILRVHVPAGTHVLPGSSSERELILPRGGHMRVGKTREMYQHPDGSVQTKPPVYSGSAKVEFRTVLIKDVYYTAPKSTPELPPTTGDMYEGEQYHAFRPMETRAVLSAGFLDRITWGEFDVEVVKPGENRMAGLGGQFAKGGGRVPGGWKASMSRAEANDWASESVLTEDFYHGTPSKAVATKIGNEGFNLEASTRGSGSNPLGKGVYLSDAQSIAEGYQIGDAGKTLTIKVNVKKVAKLDDVMEIVKADFQGPLNDPAVKAKVGSHITNALKAKGFDAIYYDGLHELVVFDPRNITIVLDETRIASQSTRFNPFIPLERRMSGLGGQFAKGGGRVPGRANTETGRALEAALAETGPLLQRHAELLAILDSPAFFSSRTSDYQRHVITQEWQTVAPAANAAQKKVFEAAAAHAESLQQHQPAIDPHAEKWAGVTIEHRVIVSHPDLPAGSMDSEALAYVVKPDKWMKARDRYVVADTPTVAMNAALRGEQPITSGIKQRISEANYLTKGVTTSDGVVNRTMALTPEHAASITPGDTWESVGFQSVQTGSMSSYDRVGDNPGTVNVSMNIRVPAGTHAGDVGVGELILRPGKMTIVSSEFNRGVQDVVAEWNP